MMNVVHVMNRGVATIVIQAVTKYKRTRVASHGRQHERSNREYCLLYCKIILYISKLGLNFDKIKGFEEFVYHLRGRKLIDLVGC